eukprot:393421-Pleurochrysis_carterae.AAC.1
MPTAQKARSLPPSADSVRRMSESSTLYRGVRKKGVGERGVATPFSQITFFGRREVAHESGEGRARIVAGVAWAWAHGGKVLADQIVAAALPERAQRHRQITTRRRRRQEDRRSRRRRRLAPRPCSRRR